MTSGKGAAWLSIKVSRPVQNDAWPLARRRRLRLIVFGFGFWALDLGLRVRVRAEIHFRAELATGSRDEYRRRRRQDRPTLNIHIKRASGRATDRRTKTRASTRARARARAGAKPEAGSQFFARLLALSRATISRRPAIYVSLGGHLCEPAASGHVSGPLTFALGVLSYVIWATPATGKRQDLAPPNAAGGA